MFMRVQRTVPQFTFSLSESFVNHKTSVSTGFFRFFPALSAFGHLFSEKAQQNDEILFFLPFSRAILSPHRVDVLHSSARR
jgi:hypothetical protein